MGGRTKASRIGLTLYVADTEPCVEVQKGKLEQVIHIVLTLSKLGPGEPDFHLDSDVQAMDLHRTQQ